MKIETAVQTKWTIDKAHSEIAFRVKHMMIASVTGYFEDFDASVETADEDFTDARVNFTARIDSVNTKNRDRDAHLRSDDFFNAATWPEMTFTATAFDGQTLTGDLTIRAITREVILTVDFNGLAVDPYGQTRAGFEVRGSINRKDFNLSRSAITDAGSIVVADIVTIIADLQFIKN